MPVNVLEPEKVSQQPELGMARSDTMVVNWGRKSWLHSLVLTKPKGNLKFVSRVSLLSAAFEGAPRLWCNPHSLLSCIYLKCFPLG